MTILEASNWLIGMDRDMQVRILVEWHRMKQQVAAQLLSVPTGVDDWVDRSVIEAKRLRGHHVIPTSASVVTMGFVPRRRRTGTTSELQKRTLFTIMMSGLCSRRARSTWKRKVGAMP